MAGQAEVAWGWGWACGAPPGRVRGLFGEDRAEADGAVCALVGEEPVWSVRSASAAHDEADEAGDDADGEGGAGEDEGHAAHFGEEAGAR